MCDTVIETARLYLRHFRNGDEYDLFEYLSEPEVNKFQGNGYAYEAASVLIDYLFGNLSVRRIYAYTEDYNLASQHLCEKLGMRREGLFLEFISFVNNPDGTPRYENTVQYAILKKEWDRQQSQ